jgi:predicted O-linked N-acetylglucosamine transferase (SPINDLY family)
MAHPTLRETFDLAMRHHQAGRSHDAEQLYRQILAAQPEHGGALHYLGVIAHQAGRNDIAVDLIRRAITLAPGDAQAHNSLGIALKNVGQLDQAVATYHQAIALWPKFVEAYSNLGNALREKGQLNEAVAACQKALSLRPDYAEAHCNLGLALQEGGKLEEAIACYRRAIALRPIYPDAYNNLGNAFKDMGQLDEAIAAYRQAVALNPDLPGAHSNLLLTLNYHPDMDANQIAVEHRAWADRHAPPPAGEIITHNNERSPNRRIRIGYISSDFRRHSAGYFLLPLLESHDHSNFEIFCYANVQRSDDFTERMKRSSDVWRNIFGLSDESAAKLIRSDGIDILVDLSGHTAGNRLRVLARRPAPIGATYLGYANTTGMMAIDYRLTDAVADPPGMTDEMNVEKLWRLPICAWCYHAPQEAPVVQDRAGGPITFGCFNAFAKINNQFAAIWVELLKRVPQSRLLLKSAGAGETSSQRRLIAQFAEWGISSDRIEMRGRTADSREHLQLYSLVDVALDTYPYHGTTTTCEALWMGAPVVTLAGRTHVSRVGASLLSTIGLSELIAQTPERYVQIAAALVENPSRLAELRRALRPRMQASPLMDALGFAREIEAAYRRMWRRWCEG